MNTQRLIEILESFRRDGHSYNDEDCWYSCPAHEDYCGNDERGVCRCGLEQDNKLIDEAIGILNENPRI